MLQKPAALLLRIVDRLRKIQLNRRLDRLKDILTPSELSEVRKDLEWEQQARKDFEDALAEVSALGLNKAGVSSEYSPYVALAMSGGELAYAHISSLDRLEKLVQSKLAAIKSAAVPTAEIDSLLATAGMPPDKIAELKEKLAGKK